MRREIWRRWVCNKKKRYTTLVVGCAVNDVPGVGPTDVIRVRF